MSLKMSPPQKQSSKFAPSLLIATAALSALACGQPANAQSTPPANQGWVFDHYDNSVSAGYYWTNSPQIFGYSLVYINGQFVQAPGYSSYTHDQHLWRGMYGGTLVSVSIRPAFRWTGSSTQIPSPLCLKVEGDAESRFPQNQAGASWALLYTDDGIGDAITDFSMDSTRGYFYWGVPLNLIPHGQVIGAISFGKHLKTYTFTMPLATGSIYEPAFSLTANDMIDFYWDFGNPNIPISQQ